MRMPSTLKKPTMRAEAIVASRRFRKIRAMFAANSPAAQSGALVPVVLATVTAKPT